MITIGRELRMRIKILSPLLANQIAAGEVVERPASVVKELVENSLDAKATQITIDIKQGGQALIRVRDDGQGMVKEDLALALARHATSKITELTDLEAVASLGFRGEALASISAVSRLKLISRHHLSDHAWRVRNDQAESAPEPAAHPPGTTVEVEDLFFNTPARRKFLRSAQTEFEHIEAVVYKLALSRFDVGFRLTHNQRLVFTANPAATPIEREQRLAAILGTEFIENAIHIDWAAGELNLNGWLGLPKFNRSQADMQYGYLNGRYVRDKLLTHAVRQAYEDVLFNNRHPAYVLYLACHPNKVDVNVHPTKHEVRFRDSRTVHQFIVHGVHDALEKIRPAPVIMPKPCSQPSSQPFYYHPPSGLHPPPAQQLSFAVQEPPPLPIVAVTPEPAPAVQSLGTALAQLRNTYILAQNEHGLLIVDIHAAHERILYEKMKQEQSEQGMMTQSLLAPISIGLSRQEFQTWEKYQSELATLGLVTEALGPETILVREIPVLLQKTDIAQIIHDVLADLMTHVSSARISETINELMGNIACRRAVRANYSLTIPEMNSLLRQMEQTAHSSHCNHGRPTWKQLSWPELDKFFLRGR